MAVSNKASKDTILSFLARHLGPRFLGMRNWLLISLFFLLCIVLLGGFAAAPLSALVFSVIIGLKIGALVSFFASAGICVKLLIEDYIKTAANKAEYFWLPYLQDKWVDDFLPWIKVPINAAKFSIGFLLFVVAFGVLLCACCPAIGLVIPGITAVVSFVSAAFLNTSLFGGSWIFTALFVGVGTMLGYDIFYRLEDSFSESVEAENMQQDGLDFSSKFLQENVDEKSNDNALPLYLPENKIPAPEEEREFIKKTFLNSYNA